MTVKLIWLVLLSVFIGQVPATSSYVDVTDYGANGEDTELDDVAIEQAIKVAAAKNLPLYFPAGTFLISRTIMLNYRNTNVGIIGSGMHATTIKVDEANWDKDSPVAIYSKACYATYKDFSLTSSRKIKLSGIHFDFYGGHGNQSNIKVNNFNGFGVKYVAIWDSYVENLIIEHCGNDQQWAFAVVGGHDTSNHTTFNRLQVELAHDKAMYVASSSLNLVFIGLHSERLIRESSSRKDVSHSLRGGVCSYINARIENKDSVSRILLGNSMGSYTDFRCGGQDVEISYGSSSSQRINNLICQSLIIPGSNKSKILLENAVVYGSVRIKNQNQNFPEFRNCTLLGAIRHTGNTSKAVFSDCNISDTTFLKVTEGANIMRSSFIQ